MNQEFFGETIGSIGVIGLLLYLVIGFFKSQIKEKKKIIELKKTGKRKEATIVDYIIFSFYDIGPDELKTELYPVIEFFDDSHNLRKQICYQINGWNTFYKKEYEIGTKIVIYYKESLENYEQLNFDKKIFLNKSYPKLKTISDRKGVFNVMSRDQVISSEVYKNKIPNFPLSNITLENILIDDDNLNKKIRRPAIIMLIYLFVASIIILALVWLL